jgi:hypothetical protein
MRHILNSKNAQPLDKNLNLAMPTFGPTIREYYTCPYCKCRTLKTDFLFQILRDNMFNVKNPVFTECENHIGSKPYQGYSSFIHSVKWADFFSNHNKYIDIAVAIRQNINDYELTKTVK